MCGPRPSPEMKRSRNEAAGFLNKWRDERQAVRLTRVMHDICIIFTHLQKKLRKSNLTIPEVLEARDSAISQLIIMSDEPLPGGKEAEMPNNGDGDLPRRRVITTNVTTARAFDAVRQEVVQGALNFLEERLALEQQELVSTMQSLVAAESEKTFITAGQALVRDLFRKERVTDLVTSACDNWRAMCGGRDAANSLGEKLWAMFSNSEGICKQLLGSFLALTPHSMGTERAVSHFNLIRSSHRLSMSEETVNSRLLVALNGVGTALYDPRPAVAKFLALKDRRNRSTDSSVYVGREFMKKFFRDGGDVEASCCISHS